MISNTCLFLCGLLILVIVGLWISNRTNTDTFNIRKDMGKPCNIDSDCGNGDFCYFGQCWGYWKGYPMPWNNCKNPYCTSIDTNLTCGADNGKCSPYCKCIPNRRPGGSINGDCFPSCGGVCLTNDDCPPGCPQCSNGVCSPPASNTPVF
jgi:hypothetical protein